MCSETVFKGNNEQFYIYGNLKNYVQYLIQNKIENCQIN